MGILSALRSFSQQGQAVGIMCTASHNLEPDNGIKMADPDGGMLNSVIWEQYAVSLANAISVQDVLLILQRIILKEFANVSRKKQEAEMKVHFGRDTRAHSPHLTALAIAAAKSLHDINHPNSQQSVQIFDHGIVTTPQLHYFVMHANAHRLPNVIPFHYNIHGYFDAICHSYLALLQTKSNQQTHSSTLKHNKRIWTVDCACGVGSYHIQNLNHKLKQLSYPLAAQFHVVNGVNEGPLNDNCGAEYVQKQQKPPIIYSNGIPESNMITSNTKLENELDRFENITRLECSVDGDADRIVFHFQTNNTHSSFRLLDGDKIAVLVASFVQNELTHLMNALDRGGHNDLRCGVVQTAYANGASTDYLKNVTKTKVSIAKTGVKFVHATAHSSYDIGIYFEANGHGTILFGPKFYRFLSHAENQLLLDPSKSLSSLSSTHRNRALVAFQRLRALPSLVNQAVGDAICDLLLVDAILCLQDWDLQEWDSLYMDRPSRQLKLKVQDRSMIKTNGNETRIVSPSNLQRALDQEMKILQNSSSICARCFVRPSGTEDAVRIYAEANTQKDADKLADVTKYYVGFYCGNEQNDNSKQGVQSKL